MGTMDYDSTLRRLQENGLLLPTTPNTGSAPANPAAVSGQSVEAEQQEAVVRQSLAKTYDLEPDRAARAANLAKKLNRPFGYVARNLDEIEKREAGLGVDVAGMRANAPAVAEWMERPENAAVARDDVKTLEKVDHALRFAARGSVGDQNLPLFGEGGWL